MLTNDDDFLLLERPPSALTYACFLALWHAQSALKRATWVIFSLRWCLLLVKQAGVWEDKISSTHSSLSCCSTVGTWWQIESTSFRDSGESSCTNWAYWRTAMASHRRFVVAVIDSPSHRELTIRVQLEILALGFSPVPPSVCHSYVCRRLQSPT